MSSDAVSYEMTCYEMCYRAAESSQDASSEGRWHEGPCGLHIGHPQLYVPLTMITL